MSMISPRLTISRASFSVNVADLDVLVLVLLRLVFRHAQARHAEEEHLLVAVARRREHRAEADHGVRHLADLFVALPPRGLFRRLTFVHAARRTFPEPLIDRVAILPDQDDVARFGHRHDDHRRRVADDVHGDLAAVRHPHAVAIDVEHFAVEDSFGGEAFGIVHVSLDASASSRSAMSSITASRSGGSGEIELDAAAVGTGA